MIKKCPTLFYKDGFKKICAYLKLKGVEPLLAGDGFGVAGEAVGFGSDHKLDGRETTRL